MCGHLASGGAFYQELRVVGRSGDVVRFDIHRRCQFFLDGASHFALGAVPADLVANFEVFGGHDFALAG